jgi:hypothetical protein
MAQDKMNVKLERRLVDLQNKIGDLGVKLDALMKNNMKPEDVKAVKLPIHEPLPEVEAHPYRELTISQDPASTIRPPLVLPEGKMPSDVIEEEMEERQDMSTIPAPKVETPPPPPSPEPQPAPPPPAPVPSGHK